MRQSTLMKAILTVASILVVGFLTKAMATSFAPPQDRVVKSPNGQYLLDINAKSGRHEVRKGKKLLWSFKREVWHHDYFVSNDGRFVLWVSWEYVQADDVKKKEALTVYSSEGVALKKTFAEVGKPRPYRKDEIGPIGDFWRIWRGKITRKEELISIPVEGKKKAFIIDLSKMEELRKAEQGGDAKRE